MAMIFRARSAAESSTHARRHPLSSCCKHSTQHGSRLLVRSTQPTALFATNLKRPTPHDPPLAPTHLSGIKVKRSLSAITRSASDLVQTSSASVAQPAAAAASVSARRAVVVGGGPAGCLVALLLAQQGWAVHVMEMRDQDSSVGSQSKLRSWAIAVYSRGINAILKAVPDAAQFFRSRTYQALVFHNKEGAVRGQMDRKDSGAALVHRTDVAALLTAAMQRHTDTISMHYGSRLSAVDFDAQLATFEVSSPSHSSTAGAAAAEKLELEYDLLVGADGAQSAVRAALIHAFPSSIRVLLLCPSEGRVYKAYHGMPQDPQALLWDPEGHGGTPAEVAAAIDAGHWPAAGRPSDPGICFNVMPLKQRGYEFTTSYDIDKGTYSGYFPFSEESLPQPHDSEEAWFSWLESMAFPPLPRSWHRQLAQQLSQGPINRIANVQRASTFTLPGTCTVLIGDAAHTVTPALGQGINSALEDAVLLTDALRASDTSSASGVEAALSAFTRSRLPQIEAMQLLELSMRSLSTPILHDTWLGNLIARLRGIPPAYEMFGNNKATTWQRVRVAIYAKAKTNVATSLVFMLGQRRASAWLPWLLKGPPMIEVQMGKVDYITMIRIMDAYALLMGGAAAAAAALLAQALLSWSPSWASAAQLLS